MIFYDRLHGTLLWLFRKCVNWIENACPYPVVESHELNTLAKARSTRCSQHTVFVPAEIFQMKHSLSTTSLTKL